MQNSDIQFIKEVYRSLKTVSILTGKCIDIINDYYLNNDQDKFSDLIYAYNNSLFSYLKNNLKKKPEYSFYDLESVFNDLDVNLKSCKTLDFITLEFNTAFLNVDNKSFKNIYNAFSPEIKSLTESIDKSNLKWNEVFDNISQNSEYFLSKNLYADFYKLEVYKDLLKVKVVLMYCNIVNEFLTEFWYSRLQEEHNQSTKSDNLQSSADKSKVDNQNRNIILARTNDIPIYTFFLGELNLYQKIENNTSKESCNHYTYWAEKFNKKYYHYFNPNQKTGNILGNFHSLKQLSKGEKPKNEKIKEIVHRVKQQLLIEHPDKKVEIETLLVKYLQ